jgi:hypothetical protein
MRSAHGFGSGWRAAFEAIWHMTLALTLEERGVVVPSPRRILRQAILVAIGPVEPPVGRERSRTRNPEDPQ